MGDMADDARAIAEMEYLNPLDLQVRMAARVRSRKTWRQGTSKLRFIRAMKGTRGIQGLIAANLGVTYSTVHGLLNRPDWVDVRQAWLDEKEKSADRAEDAILKSIEDYDEDAALATANARWLLSKLRPKEFGDKTTTILEGGENPIKVMQGMVDLNQLNLPPEIKRQVLNALDARDEAEREAAALQAPVAAQLPAPVAHFPPTPMMGGFVARVPAKAKVGVRRSK
jgi:hypothetical protein